MMGFEYSEEQRREIIKAIALKDVADADSVLDFLTEKATHLVERRRSEKDAPSKKVAERELKKLTMTLNTIHPWVHTKLNDALAENRVTLDDIIGAVERDEVGAVESEPVAAAQPERREVAVEEGAKTSPTVKEELPPLARIIGRMLLPEGGPAVDVPLKLHGWPGNSAELAEYGRTVEWEDVEVRSDIEGRFAVEFVPPPPYQFILDAKADGYAEARRHIDRCVNQPRPDHGTRLDSCPAKKQ